MRTTPIHKQRNKNCDIANMIVWKCILCVWVGGDTNEWKKKLEQIGRFIINQIFAIRNKQRMKYPLALVC